MANFSQWAMRHDGVIAEDQAVRVVLRGRESSPVTINGLAARILSTQKPRSGWFNAWDGCGAAVETREIHIDLSHNPPTTSWYDKDGNEMSPLTLKLIPPTMRSSTSLHILLAKKSSGFWRSPTRQPAKMVCYGLTMR